MRKLIDANVILRYLLGAPPEMAEQAKKIIMSGAFTTPEVLAEVVYVLLKVYNVEKSEICEALTGVLYDIEIENKETMLFSLELYSTHNLDFVDCILAARARVLCEDVFTFDKKLDKLITQITSESEQPEGEP